MTIVESSAPTRVDLAGGTLDIWPLFLLVPGAVTVNAALTLRAHARLEKIPGPVEAVAEDLDLRWQEGDEGGACPLPLHRAILRHSGCDRDLRAVTRSEVPAGSGLGGSSSLAIALLAALDHHQGLSRSGLDLARIARDVEGQVLRVPTGMQDHLAAVRGGISAIEFGPGPPRARALSLDPSDLSAMALVVYLGASRASATANWDMVRRAVDGEPVTLEALGAIAGIARSMADALEAGRMEEAGRLMAAEWEERRRLSPEVTTPRTDAAIRTALEAGAHGAKICGAGGGGCLLILSPPEMRPAVAGKMRAMDCDVLDCAVDARGLEVGDASKA